VCNGHKTDILISVIRNTLHSHSVIAMPHKIIFVLLDFTLVSFRCPP